MGPPTAHIPDETSISVVIKFANIAISESHFCDKQFLLSVSVLYRPFKENMSVEI